MLRSREFHRSIRNAWNPAFFSQSLEGYASLMNSGADGLVRRLAQSAAKSEEIDIWRTLGDMTMAVVGSASFGQAPSPYKKLAGLAYTALFLFTCMPAKSDIWHVWAGSEDQMTSAVEGCPAISLWLDLGQGNLESSKSID